MFSYWLDVTSITHSDASSQRAPCSHAIHDTPGMRVMNVISSWSRAITAALQYNNAEATSTFLIN